MRNILILTATIAALWGAAASAAVWQIYDHPDGAHGGNYALVNGPSDTYSATNGTGLFLKYDAGAGVASLAGDVRSNQTGLLWNISQTFSGLSQNLSGGFFDFAGQTQGTMSQGGSSFDLGGMSTPQGLFGTLNADGWRLPGDDSTWTFRSWLTFDGKCAQKPCDWFSIAVPYTPPATVPIPASLPLILMGLGAIGLMRRKAT